MTRLGRFWILISFVLHSFEASVLAYKNVYGNELEPCSSGGMALTGYTRNGKCVDQYDDHGSHHICIDLSTNTGGNFCAVTGQPDWCSSQMGCHEDSSSFCQIQNWCVCQWAFATYVQNAGGCEKIQNIVCESINLEAVRAYMKKSGVEKYDEALSCIAQRCSLDLSNEEMYGIRIKSSGFVGKSIFVTFACHIVVRISSEF